mgnify:CR=1 FL=1
MLTHEISANKDCLISLSPAQSGAMSLTFKVPTKRYGDELLNLDCAPELIGLGLFPNFKEVTESFSCFNAVRRYVPVPLDDHNVTAFIVGDGGTPRTGATFAFRTKWDVVSIDPILNHKPQWSEIQRLVLYRNKINELTFDVDTAVIIMPHSHAPILDVLNNISARIRHLIAMPCCQEQVLEKKPDIEYADWGVWSPERYVRIWLDI